MFPHLTNGYNNNPCPAYHTGLLRSNEIVFIIVTIHGILKIFQAQCQEPYIYFLIEFSVLRDWLLLPPIFQKRKLKLEGLSHTPWPHSCEVLFLKSKPKLFSVIAMPKSPHYSLKKHSVVSTNIMNSTFKASFN